MAGFLLVMTSGFFEPAGGRSSVWFQHAAWFLGHPDVWLQIVQIIGFIVGALWLAVWLWRQGRRGLSSLVLGSFSATLIMAFYAARTVHSIFTEGASAGAQTDWSFYYLRSFGLVMGAVTLLVLVIGGLKMFRSRGQILRNAVSNLFLLTVALLLISTYFISSVIRNSDDLLHDTYFLATHQQPFLVSILCCFIFAAFYRCFHAIFKVNYRSVLAWAHWVCFTAGVLALFHKLVDPLEGMPRRYVDYAPLEQTTDWALIGAAFVTLFSFLVLGICIIEALYRRLKHGKEPDRYHDRPDVYS